MRPKDIGTAGETRVVNYLRENGFPQVERRALHGNLDLGDITGCPNLVWEVKAGEAAKTASDKQIMDWLDETEIEKENARAVLGVLVTARHRKGAGDWWAHIYADDLAALIAEEVEVVGHLIPVRLKLSDLVVMLRHAGFGNPLT